MSSSDTLRPTNIAGYLEDQFPLKETLCQVPCRSPLKPRKDNNKQLKQISDAQWAWEKRHPFWLVEFQEEPFQKKLKKGAESTGQLKQMTSLGK